LTGFVCWAGRKLLSWEPAIFFPSPISAPWEEISAIFCRPGLRRGLPHRVDDRIIGRYPGGRSERVRIGENVTTKYQFGLAFVEPGVEGTYLDVVRGKDELAIRVQPRLIEGGLASRYEADEAKLKDFFAFRLRKP
jgi:hypothetical protein